MGFKTIWNGIIEAYYDGVYTCMLKHWFRGAHKDHEIMKHFKGQGWGLGWE
jgi:hypothetical protein